MHDNLIKLKKSHHKIIRNRTFFKNSNAQTQKL